MNHFLSRNSLFHSLLPREISMLAGNGFEKLYRPGERIISEGESGKHLFFILEGSIRIFKEIDGKIPIPISILKTDDIFGEIVAISGKPYPFSASALEDTKLLLLRGDLIHRFLSNEDFRDHFISTLYQRILYMSQLIEDLSRMDIEERLYRFLYQKYGMKTIYQVAMNKTEIAFNIGTIPETMSRLIKRLSQSGILAWKGDTIELQKDFWLDAEFSWLQPSAVDFHNSKQES